MNLNSPYKKIIKVLDNKFVSFFIYHMVPNGLEEIHYGKNDSNEILVFACITIPGESDSNTHYIK